MVEIRTLSGLFRAVALYLPRIFIWVVVALECSHRNFADRFLFLVQLTWNLRIDFASVGIVQPLHREKQKSPTHRNNGRRKDRPIC